MNVDDEVRGEKGVAVCLRDMGDGTSRLFFDDVKADSVKNPISWKYECFYTFTPALKNKLLNGMKLSDDQYQQIGVALVARLLALAARTGNTVVV